MINRLKKTSMAVSSLQKMSEMWHQNFYAMESR